MIVKFFSEKIKAKKITKEIQNKVKKILQTGQYTNSKYVGEFEKIFRKNFKTKYCVAVNNGTSALHLSLLALGIKKNDEILVPSMTFIASAAAINYVGAKPIFVDVNEKDWLINPNIIEKFINKKTKAIMVVHLHGLMCDMDKIKKIANKYKLKIIEDAAQAHGSSFKNKLPGHYSDVATFSFYPTKNLGGIGDGGCIITNNKKIYKKLKDLREFGWKKRYDSSVVGLNSRLGEIQAAILRIKLKKLNFYNKERNKIANNYYKKLNKLKSIKLPKLTVNSNHTYHQFVIKVDQSIRDKLIHFCKMNNVMLGIHYPTPLHKQRAFIKKNFKIKIVEKISKQIVSLPIFPYLSLAKQDKIIRIISLFINRYEKKNTY